MKDLINGKSIDDSPKDQSASVDLSDAVPDETTEEAIIKSCKLLAQELTDERPRLATALEGVNISLNRVRFIVSNDTLSDEIERNMFEMKRRIRELGNIKCPIEFDIVVAVDNSSIKPIKVEDKLKYLTELNPELTRFRKLLDLDIE